MSPGVRYNHNQALNSFSESGGGVLQVTRGVAETHRRINDEPRMIPGSSGLAHSDLIGKTAGLNLQSAMLDASPGRRYGIRDSPGMSTNGGSEGSPPQHENDPYHKSRKSRFYDFDL